MKEARFSLWVKKVPWRRKWQPTPGFLPEESHGQRSLVGCSPWGCERVGHSLATKYQSIHRLRVICRPISFHSIQWLQAKVMKVYSKVAELLVFNEKGSLLCVTEAFFMGKPSWGTLNEDL